MAIRLAASHHAGLAAVLLAFAMLAAARAEDAPPPQEHPAAAPSGQKSGAGRAGAPASPAAAEQHKLPPDSTTKQTLALPGRTLDFHRDRGLDPPVRRQGRAAGRYRLYRPISWTAPIRATRPVTFLFNGGPGASSACLQFGAAGPWRLSIDGDAAQFPPRRPICSPTPRPGSISPISSSSIPSAPAIAASSRPAMTCASGSSRSMATSASIALMIRRWLEKSDRLLSPKFVAGESYGGIRGPKIVRNLQTEQGVGVQGLILVSPVLDFREFTGSSLLQYVSSLPSMAAVAREAKGAVTRADLADVESYARGDFLLDLVKGQADTAATNRLADKVAALTGIDQAVSRRLAGRFDVVEFRREFDRKNGKVTGRYDASVTGIDPYPDSSFFHFNDPSGEALTGAADQRRGRPHHAQAQLAAGRLLSSAQRGGRKGLGFRPRRQSAPVGFPVAADSRARSEAETADRARAVRSGHAVFRHPKIELDQLAGLCLARSGEARGLSRRPHVLFARRLAAGVPRRGRGADEVSRRKTKPAQLLRPRRL